MLKKILIVIPIIVSPFVSLLALTPLSIIPAYVLSMVASANQCGNIQGESLCGLLEMVNYILIINMLLGFFVTLTAMLLINHKWPIRKKMTNSFWLFLYFSGASAISFYLMNS